MQKDVQAWWRKQTSVYSTQGHRGWKKLIAERRGRLRAVPLTPDEAELVEAILGRFGSEFVGVRDIVFYTIT